MNDSVQGNAVRIDKADFIIQAYLMARFISPREKQLSYSKQPVNLDFCMKLLHIFTFSCFSGGFQR